MEIINLITDLTFTQLLKIFVIIAFVIYFAHLLYTEDHLKKEEDKKGNGIKKEGKK